MDANLERRSQIITEIAKKCIAGVSIRGDLEMHGCDSEDNIETTVGAIQTALEAAYAAGQADRSNDKE